MPVFSPLRKGQTARENKMKFRNNIPNPNVGATLAVAPRAVALNPNTHTHCANTATKNANTHRKMANITAQGDREGRPYATHPTVAKPTILLTAQTLSPFNHRRPTMAKKTPILAIIICTMMIFPSTANANWLAIVKGIIGGAVGMMQIPVSKLADEPASKPAPEPASKATPKTDSPPTPIEVLDALNKLGIECKNIASKGIPCVLEGGRGTTPENARRIANRNAIAAMGMAINTYVKGNTDLIRKQLEEDGIPTDVNEFDEKISLSVNQTVNGAQTFLSYMYIDEDATQKSGKKVYVATEVMVLNSEFFEKALEETAAGKSISQQFIDETRKSVVSKLKSIFIKRK
jgi:hypothetical protein